jgi:tetratricopeptide (TPR) repeat protein
MAVVCRMGLVVRVLILLLAALSVAAETLPDGAQALSLAGKPLYPAPASARTLENLAAAKSAYAADPSDADNIIWLGRRTAYAGDYRQAIRIFSEGIEKHPEDPRFYRHRGHRFISLRKFDSAIADLQRAVVLMQGLAIQVEPDGLPNALNIPLTTTQDNVWYHLGLAYYLKQDWPLALAAFRSAYRLGGNDDNLVSAGHWIYMILRRMGRDDSAARALQDISRDMTIIENSSYHQLCLLYKGMLTIEELEGAGSDDPGDAALAYGIANYLHYSSDKYDDGMSRSDALLERIVAGSSWSSFGFIAAEADLANRLR